MATSMLRRTASVREAFDRRDGETSLAKRAGTRRAPWELA